MKLKTRIFEICKEKNIELVDLAKTMNISLSHIKKIEKGEANINSEFIVESLKAFPDCDTSDLFFFIH